jgi:hypothetical protein
MLVVFGQALEILADMPGSDLRQLAPAVFLGPLEKKLHRVQIGALGMLVADRAEEELPRGEHGVGAAAVNNLRQFIGDG